MNLQLWMFYNVFFKLQSQRTWKEGPVALSFTLLFVSNVGLYFSIIPCLALPLFILLFLDTLYLQRRDVFSDFQRRLYAAQAAHKVDVAAGVEPVQFLPQEVQVSRWWSVSLSTETLLCGHSKGPALDCASARPGHQGLSRCPSHVPGCSCMCGFLLSY